MTRIVGAFEAKTKLSELLDLVERGEEVLITRRGKRVARLGPLSSEGAEKARTRQAIARIKRLGKKTRLPEGTTLKALIEEGRS